MPTVFTYKGYRFFFFSKENDEPIHIHVEKDDKYAKFWIKPIELARNIRFKSHELHQISMIIRQHKKQIEEKWYDYFN